MVTKKKRTYGTAEQEIPPMPTYVAQPVEQITPENIAVQKPVITNTTKQTTTQAPAPAPTNQPYFNPNVAPWRQELANARAARAGAEPINLKTNMTATEEQIRKNIATQALQGQIEQSMIPPPSAEALAASQQLGAINTFTPEQFNPVSIGQALKEGLVQGGTGAAAGAGVGAATGLVTGGALSIPAAAVIGAIGGIGGFIKGTMQSLKRQTKENVAGEFSNLRQARINLKAIISDTNQGGDPIENMVIFQQQLDIIDESYAKLKLIDQKKPLGEDDTVEMAKFEMFYTAGGARQYLVNEMQQAVYNPNPSKILNTIEDFTEE
jgi:hypothetical protein